MRTTPSVDWRVQLSRRSLDDIVLYSWCVGLLIAGMQADERGTFLSALLSEVLRVPIKIRIRLLEEFAQHLEELPSVDQQLLLRACFKHTGQPLRGLTPTPEVNDWIGFLVRRGTTATTVASGITSAAPPPSGNGDDQQTSRRILCARTRSAKASPSKNAGNKKPRVALVVPEFLSAGSFLQPPTGMLLAATRLRRSGYSVVLLDNRVQRLPLDMLGSRLGPADIIAVTTTPYDHIQNYFLDYRLRYAFKTIDSLKHHSPRASVVACGAHGTVRPDIVFRDTKADLVLKGEFDTGLPLLVNALENENDPSALREVCTREQATSQPPDRLGAVPPYELADVSSCFQLRRTSDDDIPAYDLIDFDDYHGDSYINNRLRRRKRWAAVLATRGCAHDCSFCYNFWGRRVRYRGAESVVEELSCLQDNYHVTDVFFTDFNFTQNSKWVAEVCGRLRARRSTVRWSAQARCDSVPEDLLAEMASAGCDQLWFGVESFDSKMVNLMRKYRDPGVATSAIAGCRKVGIEPHLFIMIGLPGESRASLNNTIAQMHATKASYCGVMIATPRFGTKYYELAKQQFPQLGNDFYSLRSVRGLVANDLDPLDLYEAMAIFEDRDFMYRDHAPQLSDRKRCSDARLSYN